MDEAPTLKTSRLFGRVRKAKEEIAVREAAALNPVVVVEPEPPAQVIDLSQKKKPVRWGEPWTTSRMTEGKRKALQAQVYRGLGMSTAQIAERLGVSQGYIKSLFKKLRVGGMECIKAAEDRLDEEAVPIAVDKLILGLQSGDKDYVLETLKGRHRLLTTQPLPTQTPEGQMLQIRIEAPNGQSITATTGQVVGTPNDLDEE